MNAIHINWSKPFTIRNKAFFVEDFELLTTILSAMKWREKNGKIKLVADEAAIMLYKEMGLLCLWDNGVEALHVDEDIDSVMFWAAGKLFALKEQTAPVAVLDTDFIVWDSILFDKLPECSVIHFEDLYPDVYPDFEYFKMKNGYSFNGFDRTVKPCNTAFAVFKDGELLKYYTETAVNFMKNSENTGDTLKYMVFAEQRLLPVCAKKVGAEILAFSDLPRLFKDGSQCFTHTWGMKQQMRDNEALRYEFCMRCINRIKNEYPEIYEILRDIDMFKRYIG